MKKDKEAQEKYLEFQMLQQQLEAMHKYLEEIEGKRAEFHQAQQCLRELEKASPGSELFVPITQGIFAKANIQDTSELLVNVGANTAVTKSIPQVTELIKSQIGEIETVRIQLGGNIEKLTERINSLVEELQAISE